MRARKIYETINFEQGGDPYSKLSIGQNRPFVNGDEIELTENVYLAVLYKSTSLPGGKELMTCTNEEIIKFKGYNVIPKSLKGQRLTYNGYYFESDSYRNNERRVSESLDFIINHPNIYKRIYK